MEYSGRMCRKEENTMMKLKKHGAFLVNFVIDFANGDMSRFFFDLDYSGYVIEHFPEFEREHCRLPEGLQIR